MKPRTFDQAIKTLGAPIGNPNVRQLPVYSDGQQCISCWKPSIKERIRIMCGNPVWLSVLSGNTQPPVNVSAESPFEEPSPKTRLHLAFLDVKDFITETWAMIKYGFTQDDKRKHFRCGIYVSLIVGILAHIIGLPGGWACLAGFLVGAIAGIVKEWYDSKGHGTVEVMDFVFTAMGALVAMPFAWLLSLII